MYTGDWCGGFIGRELSWIGCWAYIGNTGDGCCWGCCCGGGVCAGFGRVLVDGACGDVGDVTGGYEF